MSGTPTAVLFDVDGTLVDSNYLHATYWPRQRPLPRAADLLRACKKRGLTVVLASSADAREFAALRAALDADDAIDEATSSADVERSKPAPGLLSGGIGRAELLDAGAAEVYDGPAELLGALPRSILTRG